MDTPATPAPAPEPAQPVTPPAPVTPQPDPAPAPPPPPAISPDGKLGENWFLALGDEFAPHAKDLSKHRDLRSVITELDYFRKNGAEYPGQDSKPEAIERFRKIAGVPDAPEGYGLTAESMKLPEGMEFDAELATEISKVAHATHTPPKALAAIAGAFNDILAARTATASAEAKAATAAAQDALVKEWRGDFAANTSTVRHLTNTLAQSAGLDPTDPALEDLANRPQFARLMFQMSRMIGEDRVQTPAGFGSLKSPAQQIAEIMAGTDPVWGQKYTKGTRQEKVAAYEHLSRLRAQAAQ